MLLTLESLMGFVVNSEKQMRMLKNGEKRACYLRVVPRRTGLSSTYPCTEDSA